MNRIKVELKNGYVFYQEHRIDKRFYKYRSEYIYCPLCNNPILEEQETYLAIANNLFPNCFIHKECYNKEYELYNEEIGFRHLTLNLIDDYEDYLSSLEIHRAWR